MPRSFYDLLQTIASLRFSASTLQHADDELGSNPPLSTLPPPKQREDLERAFQQPVTSDAETCFSRSSTALNRESLERSSRDSITEVQRDDSDTTSIWSLRPGSFISQRDAEELAAISRLLQMRFERLQGSGSRLERQAEQFRGTSPPSHDERSPSAARQFQLSGPHPHPDRQFRQLVPDTRHAPHDLLDLAAGFALAGSGESYGLLHGEMFKHRDGWLDCERELSAFSDACWV